MHKVQCRICKTYFDADKEEYALVGQRSYYHKECYDNWVKNKNNVQSKGDEEFWKESLVDYLYRDVKMSIDFSKLNSQWKNFTAPSKNYTPKGIYFTIRYYYSILHGDAEKAQGGIGIVNSLYKEAIQYWVNLEEKRKGTLDAIINQIKWRENREVKTITHKEEVKKDKAKWDLDDI